MPTQAVKGGVLLNLGTPTGPTPSEVRAYLKEFLMDPYVLDIPFLIRWTLVHGVILPKRPKTSAEAYQKVWTERGSPLLFHHLDLTDKVKKRIGPEWSIKAAMRYGNPSISKAIQELKNEGIKDITLFPLYPQYSLAATESSIQEFKKRLKEIHPEASLSVVDPFYQHNLFTSVFAKVAERSLKDYSYDHVLFSFHGLPERQIKKLDQSQAHCLAASGCCDQVRDCNSMCYRAQCFRSASLIAQEMGLRSDQYTVSFQSRLGRTPWIKPYTDELYQELPKRGLKRLAVICPAFVADCLETLEEIRIRGKEDYLRAGGEDLRLVPSLNSEDEWADSVARLIQTGGSAILH